MSINPLKLTEVDLLDINKTIREVMKDVLRGLRMEQNIVLGVLSVKLQGLQVQKPQTSTMAQYVVAGTTEVEQTLCNCIGNTFILPKGELAVANEDDRVAMSSIKGISLNLATLPCKIMY